MSEADTENIRSKTGRIRPGAGQEGDRRDKVGSIVSLDRLRADAKWEIPGHIILPEAQ